MSSPNNTTMETWTENSTNRESSVAFVILTGVLIVTGTLPNGYIVASFLKKFRGSPLNMTIVNLAIVDILVLMVVIPMCLVTLTISDVATSLCSAIGMIGQTLVTYSLHVQCLILYATVRTVTKVSPNNKAAVSLLHLVFISMACLAVDTCVTVYPSVKYGVLQKLPSVGYCFYTFSSTTLWYRAILIFYVLHISASVLLCTIFYIVLTRFVRKNSARPSLARHRHVYVFKMTFGKLLIWLLSYSFILAARAVGYQNKWPEVTFQISYLLLWSNSVLNPLCHIFTSPLRRTIVSGCLAMVATVAPHGDSQLTANNDSNQHRISSRLTNAEQSKTVMANLP